MVPTNPAMARLASQLLAIYGEGAVLAAAGRFEAMERIGNADAASAWAEVGEILALKPGEA